MQIIRTVLLLHKGNYRWFTANFGGNYWAWLTVGWTREKYFKNNLKLSQKLDTMSLLSKNNKQKKCKNPFTPHETVTGHTLHYSGGPFVVTNYLGYRDQVSIFIVY